MDSSTAAGPGRAAALAASPPLATDLSLFLNWFEELKQAVSLEQADQHRADRIAE